MAIGIIIFDWGDTLMRDFPHLAGPMVHWPQVEVLPGVQATLADLQARHVLVAASNAGDSDADLMRRALDRGGIGRFFQHVFTSRELGAAKPAPEFFLEICRRINVDPAECIMVGNDYDKDIAGARRAAMRTIWLAAGSTPADTSAADVTVASMADVPEAVQEIESAVLRGRAIEAVKDLQQQSIEKGTNRLQMDDIDAEIRAVRRKRHTRGSDG